MMDYFGLYIKIINYVPKENVHVIPYEMLKESQSLFIDRLASFFDMKDEDVNTLQVETQASSAANVRSTSSRRWLLRKKELFSFWLRPGRLFHAMGLPMKVSVPRPRMKDDKYIELTDSLEEQIMERYRASNRELSKVTGLDLGRYNYF